MSDLPVWTHTLSLSLSLSLNFGNYSSMPANSFIYTRKSVALHIESTEVLHTHLTEKPPQKSQRKMEPLPSSKHGKSISFLHYYSSFLYSGTDFLLKPVFLRGFSGLLHLVLLFVLTISWVSKKFRARHSEGPKERFKNTRSLYYKLTLICCLGVSLFSLVLCLLNYFYWYRNGWSEEALVTLLDLAVRTLAWGAVCVYLHSPSFNSGETKYPFLLRVWWGFYLSISCYSLVVDIVLYRERVNLSLQYFVSDVVSLVMGLFFCYVGFCGKNEGKDTLLEEPLLNGDSSATNEAESNKPKGVKL
ncbi:ABC transporter C family member 3-like [Juglans microcarpa x Juglans regia]|uniref:ABC transporter C family member 3-like n=1 Tax=Juglans microcarpa x Juglans regia TaxID=2249226 RepID=UPI001B7F1FA6|nr:ABC transporter C family member 3-like [Juglans microcarpa x Juglans regia]